MNCKNCGASLIGGECPVCAADRFYATSTTGAGGKPAVGAPSPPRPPVRPVAGFLVEPYDIVRTLGVGGVGVVYLAKEKATGKLVALKVLRSALRRNTEVVARFRREVEIARKLEHPNIARVHSFSENHGQIYIVMQYVEGDDLGKFLRQSAPSMDVKLAIMKSVCAAVDAAHAVGVIHRDLKPANILIATDGTPFVLDFGVASLDDDASVTRPGSFIGTPLYVSPEQAQGKKVDHRSDIYSLGAIFYELVTGRPPFIGDSAITIALKHIREEPFRPRSIDPTIPTLIEDVILRCLEKDPAGRPQKASHIVREIERPIQRELEAARAVARSGSQQPGSGDLRDISLFQYLRTLVPMKRNLLLEIVNNEEFGRYHFRGAHLVHAEAGNLRDDEVAYNLFYWTRGIYRVVTDGDPPDRETVSVPWIPYVEKVFEQFRDIVLGIHAVVQGPVVFDILDNRATSVFRYCSDGKFERGIGDRAKMSVDALQKGLTHLRNHDLRKISKVSDDAAMMFCFLSGLRHAVYVVLAADADLEAVYRWLRRDAELKLIGSLHSAMVESDRKKLDPLGPVKVLIAEQEDFLGNLVRIKLRDLGYDVVLVRDGAKVLEVAPQYRPDVILLDVNVPGISGPDVCTGLAEGADELAPVVLLTPSGRGDGVEDAWPPGVVSVMSKPLVLGELIELLGRYSSRRRERQRGRRPPVAAPRPAGQS